MKQHKKSNSILEIRKISISSAQMDLTHCYSFLLEHKLNQWLFSADCYLCVKGNRIKLTKCAISQAEAERILHQLETASLMSTEIKMNLSKLLFKACDTPTYSLEISYQDGTKLSLHCPLKGALESDLYQLAESTAVKR